MKPKYKYRWYQEIYRNIPRIHEEAKEAARELGLDEVAGRVGLYPSSSACPGPLAKYVLDAIIAANSIPVLPMSKVEDELRDLGKDIFGDDYDVAATSTCEAGLRLVFETLLAPPTMRKGEAYRGRFITPYSQDLEFVAGYGRPFPPKYKGLLVDRSTSAGEFAVEGKSLVNLDAVLVRLAGARYEPHGIRYEPVPLLTRIDHTKSLERFRRAAEIHASELVGFAAVLYDTPGYGVSEREANGASRLMRSLGKLANEFDVPFIVDCAMAPPVLTPSPRDAGADIMLWSTDKAVRAPTSGLIAGEEEVMVPVRKALGLGGERSGEPSSHGKALFSLSDPGRDAVIGLISVLKVLRDEPGRLLRPMEEMHQIITEELDNFAFHNLLKDMIITKSPAMGGTEINYEQTWTDQEFGIPIFSAEDFYAGTNPIMSALLEMGIQPPVIYSGNIIIQPGLGTLDPNGALMERPARLAVRAFVRALEIVCKYSGLPH